jgi:ATP adenylyltransferase
MTVDHLWAGWRAEYISGNARPQKGQCVLCELAKLGDEEARIVFRDSSVYVVMNAYPYTSGHVMVVPNRHEGELPNLSPDESTQLWLNVNRTIDAIKIALTPQGFNVGLNLGQASGAGFADHLHVHVVPRWSGDTNFTSALADTRVLPEALDVTAKKIRDAWSV